MCEMYSLISLGIVVKEYLEFFVMIFFIVFSLVVGLFLVEVIGEGGIGVFLIFLFFLFLLFLLEWLDLVLEIGLDLVWFLGLFFVFLLLFLMVEFCLGWLVIFIKL